MSRATADTDATTADILDAIAPRASFHAPRCPAKKRAAVLMLMAMPAALEETARSLFEEVCCGTRELWPQMTPQSMAPGSEIRDKFYELAHNGMWAAQERFVHLLETSSDASAAELALHRTAMDTCAWQMLQGQLCFARQMYREHKQPNLSHSNLRSVVAAARHLREASPASMPLITDLTTFVQIGDILQMSTGAMSIIEVKEGEKNREIGRLARFFQKSRCEAFEHAVLESTAPKTAKQFQRMVRQMDRMDFASSVMGKGRGHDPDWKMEVRIPEDHVPMAEWHENLNALFDSAQDRGWAIDVIDDALFLGAYVEPKMRAAAPAVFLPWLDRFSGADNSPVARLIDCVFIPLALPLFSIPTSPERMRDVLFGRIQVCMGISIPGLVAGCRKAGIQVRAPNKGERRTLQKSRGGTVLHEGKPIVVERDGQSMIVADGIFMRAMFHFQRPVAVIEALLSSRGEMME